MKFASIALIATTAAYRIDEPDETMALNIFGYNEGNVYDFEQGFGSAILHRDVLEKYRPCIVGMPDYALSVLDVYGGFDTSHPFNLMTTFYDPSNAKQASRVAMVGAITIKSKYTSCNKLKDEVTMVGTDMYTNYSTTQMMSNGMTVLMNSYSNFTSLSSAMYSSDFKALGKTLGEIVFTLFGNDALAARLSREEQDEKDAFAAMVKRSHEEFEKVNEL